MAGGKVSSPALTPWRLAHRHPGFQSQFHCAAQSSKAQGPLSQVLKLARDWASSPILTTSGLDCLDLCCQCQLLCVAQVRHKACSHCSPNYHRCQGVRGRALSLHPQDLMADEWWGQLSTLPPSGAGSPPHPHYQGQLYLAAQETCKAHSPESCSQGMTRQVLLLS